VIAPAAPPPSEAATRTILTGLGDIHGQGAAIDLLPVQGVDRGLSLLIGTHLHEPKSLAATGHPVGDAFGAGHAGAGERYRDGGSDNCKRS